MSRKLSISFLLALMLVMAISVAAMAAGPGPQNPDAGTGIGAGVNGTFVDENGDGVCDSFVDRVPAQDGTGSKWGAQRGGQYAQQGKGTSGANFIDEDGDGVCDNCLNGGVPAEDGTGSMMRRGRNR
ncbi:MAG: hypothetical protein R2873_03410 [Caldilineaceae bacterium]